MILLPKIEILEELSNEFIRAFTCTQVFLFGANDKHYEDRNMQVTLAYNHFGKGLVQRMPRCRWGFFHVVNNDYTHWLMYAIGGSMNPTIISEGNRFIAPPDPRAKEVQCYSISNLATENISTNNFSISQM